MKKTFTGITALLLSASLHAQTDVAEKYAKLITAEDARKHLSIIASDAFEGRETGKPGATMAANYIAAEFKRLGLQAPVNGSYFLNIPLIETSFLVQSFTVNGTPYTNGKDFFATGNSPQKTVNVSDLVFIGYGIGSDTYDDLKGMDITGKVVVYISDAEPMKEGMSIISGKATLSDWSTARGGTAKRVQLIQSKHPSLILAVSSNTAAMALRMRVGGARLSIKGGTPIPAVTNINGGVSNAPVFTISTDVADQLLKNSGKTYAALKSAIDGSGMPQSQTIKADVSSSFGSLVKDVNAVDVVGYLPGTDLKDQVLVFSAHYDHIGLTTSGTDKVNNGADDDGSGTTGILEIAKAFTQAKKDGHGPRRSILFLGNVGEEKGLLGSEYYTDHPVFPLDNTITDLNIDMIGRVGDEYKDKPDSGNYVYVIGSSMLSSDLHTINDAANKKYTQLDLDYKYDDPKDPNRFYYRSDHYNFAKHGVPIIFYFNGVHPDYHRPGDEVSKINFPLLAKRAQLVFYTGWDLANRDKRPVVDGK